MMYGASYRVIGRYGVAEAKLGGKGRARFRLCRPNALTRQTADARRRGHPGDPVEWASSPEGSLGVSTTIRSGDVMIAVGRPWANMIRASPDELRDALLRSPMITCRRS